MTGSTAGAFRPILPADSTYALHGLCSFFPHENSWSARLSDRMWGLERGDPLADRNLRDVGRRLCALCPVRNMCLADAMVNQVQNGIYGGLGLTERKTLARIMESQGLPVRGILVRGMPSLSPSEALRRRRLVAAWLESHPDITAVVRACEARTRREHRHRRSTDATHSDRKRSAG